MEAAEAPRRSEATRTATGHGAEPRERGVRAPRTMPVASAPARKDRLLGEHVAHFEIEDDKHVRQPATGDLISFIAAASGLMALSSARGHRAAPW